MENEIKKKLQLQKVIPIKTSHELERISGVLFKGTPFDAQTEIECLYCGFHYFMQRDYDKMKHYFLMAIEKGNSEAMYYFGKYYDEIEQDYGKMEHYYLMAIEKGNSEAMFRLGKYLDANEDYEQMKKYYLMAIEKGHPGAMNNLAIYYELIEQDYDQSKKYYMMAIEKGNSKSMFNMGEYYDNKGNNTLMIKYYLMAIEKGHKGAMNNLGVHYYFEKDHNQMLKYYLMAIENGNVEAISNLELYYNENVNDYTFLKCLNVLSVPPDFLYRILNERFRNGLILPENYYEDFCQLNFSNNGQRVDKIVKKKQFILQTTGIYPVSYSGTYIITFMQILALSCTRECYLPRCIMLRIGGMLFT